VSAPYDRLFLDLTLANQESAETIVPIVRSQIEVGSVVDFGCAYGAWLQAWTRSGVRDVFGVDGGWVPRERLLVPEGSFRAGDLAQPIRLGRTFDLVQSLEVGEHLPAEASSTFVENLTAHGDVVLFSAAPPGQGGERHVNERPYGYWRDLFAARGYQLVDSVRPALVQSRVQPWYKYNMFLFVRAERVAALRPEIRGKSLPSSRPVPDVSPLSYKLRKALVRLLPMPVASAVARLRARS
jgi:SAM-dependent methyltransferase